MPKNGGEAWRFGVVTMPPMVSIERPGNIFAGTELVSEAPAKSVATTRTNQATIIRESKFIQNTSNSSDAQKQCK
ncbi:MAG: hypothetical protein WCH99_19200 [Verrucomicrobiota bacterium]